MTLFVLWPRDDAPHSMPGAAELAYQLRGGPVFDELYNLGANIGLPKPGTCVMAQPTRYDPTHLVYADLGLLVDNPDVVQNLVSLGIPYIVDAHLPFARRPAIRSIQPGFNDKTRDQDHDREVADLWSSPEQIAKSIDVFEAAVAVTSPRRSWAELVRPYVPGTERTFVVPDIVDPKTGGQFYRGFARACQHAKGFGAWTRFRDSFALRRGASVMTAALAASKVDWAARLGGVR